MTWTIIGWLVIIAATIWARQQILRVYNAPTDIERYRSWRYHRALRKELRQRRRSRR